MAVYALAKLAMAVSGFVAGWAAWPALVFEALALLLVGAIVWTGTRDPVYLLGVAALLVAGGFLRVKAVREQEDR
jgi:hypothetical protein